MMEWEQSPQEPLFSTEANLLSCPKVEDVLKVLNDRNLSAGSKMLFPIRDRKYQNQEFQVIKNDVSSSKLKKSPEASLEFGFAEGEAQESVKCTYTYINIEGMEGREPEIILANKDWIKREK